MTRDSQATGGAPNGVEDLSQACRPVGSEPEARGPAVVGTVVPLSGTPLGLLQQSPRLYSSVRNVQQDALTWFRLYGGRP